jgi:hypothetical protein
MLVISFFAKFFSNLDVFQVAGESGTFNPYHVAYVQNDGTSAESYWVTCGLIKTIPV